MNAVARSSQRAAARGGVSISPRVLDIGIVLLTFAVFWPLIRFYFAQDDFVLIEHAAHGWREAIGRAFEAKPGQFRPLTKGVWFLGAYGVFGLNATGYHIASILLHGLNAVLLGGVLRRLGVSAGVSRVAAVLYAVSSAQMEAVAWASCVQQVLGATFALLTLRFGLDALAKKSSKCALLATLSYALALASYEQTVATPLVLILWVLLKDGSLSRLSRPAVWLPLAMLGLYAAFMLFWKGLPESGPYQMSLGANVWTNAMTYTRLAYALWMFYPGPGVLESGPGVSHAVLIAATVFLLVRRRAREVLFAWGALILWLLPVLFQREHTHSFHMVVPGIAAFYLLALALDECAALAGVHRKRLVTAVGALLLGALVVGCAAALHRNVDARIADGVDLPRSFVLRRAVLAERLRDGIRARYTGQPRLILVYRHRQYTANWLNVHAALGQGSAVRVFLGRPALEVVLSPPAPAPTEEQLRDETTQTLIYTEVGAVYTLEEMARLIGAKPQETSP